jgi:hypothetical protein
MATEKTPLLIKSSKNEVAVKIPDDFDENNNNVKKSKCLTYEELLPYVIDPYWIQIRRFLSYLALTGFFVILIVAYISAYTATSECRNLLTIMQQPVLNDKSYVTNATNDNIPSELVSFVLENVTKIGWFSDAHS